MKVSKFNATSSETGLNSFEMLLTELFLLCTIMTVASEHFIVFVISVVSCHLDCDF